MFINCTGRCKYQKDGTCTLNDIRNVQIDFSNITSNDSCIYCHAQPEASSRRELPQDETALQGAVYTSMDFNRQ